MKQKFLLSLLIMIALVSCKKDNDDDEPSLRGKWTMENLTYKEYENGVLADSETEPGDGTTFDFQDNGHVVIVAPGEPIESLSYTIQPGSKVEIDGEVMDIQNLTSTTVTLYDKETYGPGDYDEVFLNLKR